MTLLHRLRRRVLTGRVGVVAALLVVAGVVTAYAGGAVADPTVSPTPTPNGSAGRTGPGGTGRQVFLRDCAWCHGQQGQGTQSGPSLKGVGAQAVDFYVRTGRMPLDSPDQRVERGPAQYPDDVISDLVDYVGALVGGPAVPVVSAGDVARGRRLFISNCAACHSASGTGMVLQGGQVAPELFETHSTQIAEAMRIGPGPMPTFSDRQLEQEEVDDVVTYVQQLGDDQVKGGAGLDQFGPIVEGLVVWLVVLPLLVFGIRMLGKRAGR